MKSITTLIFLVLVGNVMARPVSVVLKVSDKIIRHYSFSVSVSLTYSDGSQFGNEVFSLQDLVAGKTSKTIFVHDSVSITSCNYRWILVRNSATLPGGNIPHPPADLNFPKGEEGTIKGKCQLIDDEFLLTIAPYRYLSAAMTITQDALVLNQATIGFFKMTPIAKNVTYSSSKMLRVTNDLTFDVTLVYPHIAKQKLTYGVTGAYRTQNGIKKKNYSFSKAQFIIED